MFLQAYNKLKKKEGGYVNDPTDKGGETYRGISRNNHPTWSGWLIIDALKKTDHFRDLLNSNTNLQDKVKEFYKTEYWDFWKADHIEQNIAEELFEASVNFGKTVEVVFLQIALNIFNRQEKLYSDIRVDGKYGPITQFTLKTSIAKGNAKRIFNALNILQGNKYIELMLNNEDYEKYIGWFDRVEIKR